MGAKEWKAAILYAKGASARRDTNVLKQICMNAVFVLAIAVVCALLWRMVAPTPPIGPYETPLFSVEFPRGSHVEFETMQDESSVTHFTNGHMRRGWANVGVTDFSKARLPIGLDTIAATTMSEGFKPGYRIGPVKDTTLGGLPAKEQAIHGVWSDSGDTLTLRWRMALSPDGMRDWVLTTNANDKDLPEANCEKFFDSFKIK